MRQPRQTGLNFSRHDPARPDVAGLHGIRQDAAPHGQISQPKTRNETLADQTGLIFSRQDAARPDVTGHDGTRQSAARRSAASQPKTGPRIATQDKSAARQGQASQPKTRKETLADRYDRQNNQAAWIILANPQTYPGLPQEWAKLFRGGTARRQTSQDTATLRQTPQGSTQPRETSLDPARQHIATQRKEQIWSNGKNQHS